MSVIFHTTWRKKLAKSWLSYSEDVSISATERFNSSIVWKSLRGVTGASRYIFEYTVGLALILYKVVCLNGGSIPKQ